MAWTTSLTEILRYYLNDADSTTYSDVRLSKFIAIAAYELVPQLSLNSTYTVDVLVPSISPDPVDDQDFAALIILKAAVVVIRSELKQLIVTAGYSVKDDRSSIDGREALKYMQELLKKFEKSFDDALEGYILGGAGRGIGCAVLSPYSTYKGG